MPPKKVLGKRASGGSQSSPREEPMEEPPFQTAPAGKKKSVSDGLTQEQEQHLSEWFSEHSVFYDQSDRNFKDRELKNQLLDVKGAEIGISGRELWQWLQSMRTMFGKLHKKKSGQARSLLTARQQWILDNFSFLTAHLLPKTKTRELGQVSELAFFFLF